MSPDWYRQQSYSISAIERVYKAKRCAQWEQRSSFAKHCERANLIYGELLTLSQKITELPIESQNDIILKINVLNEEIKKETLNDEVSQMSQEILSSIETYLNGNKAI